MIVCSKCGKSTLKRDISLENDFDYSGLSKQDIEMVEENRFELFRCRNCSHWSLLIEDRLYIYNEFKWELIESHMVRCKEVVVFS